MAIPAESRNTVRHLLNIKRPYSYENPDLRFINEGVSELTENYEAETDDVQYIGEKAKTTNIKGISRNFDLSMVYIQDDPIQDWINLVFKKPMTGAKSMCDYIRFNILEPMFGRKNQYIGVRSRATVQPSSIGGAATDSMTTAVKISASGDPKIGYVTVETDDTKGTTTFRWTDADLDTPIITSPITKSSIIGADKDTVLITGTAQPLCYVTVLYGANDYETSLEIPVSINGEWQIEIPKVNLGVNAKISAIAYERPGRTGAQSVTSVPISFTTNAPNEIEAPIITFPTSTTNVPLNEKIKGTGIPKARVTITSNNESIGTAIVGSDKNWVLDTHANFKKDTDYTITAFQEVGGKIGAFSSELKFRTTNTEPSA